MMARDGISIGEAGGFALLEKPQDVASAATTSCCSASARATTPTTCRRRIPRASARRLAMERALTAAGLAPRDIDYINLHGTATRVGDAAEDHRRIRAVRQPTRHAVPPRARPAIRWAPRGSSRRYSVLAIRHGLLPGSAQTGNGRSIVPQPLSAVTTKPARIDTVLSNSFGFGGSNCSLIFGRTR